MVSHLRPYWCLMAMLLLGLYWSGWPGLLLIPWWQLGPSCCQVCDPAVAGLYDVVHGQEPCCAEPVLPFTHFGIAGPAPYWVLYQKRSPSPLGESLAYTSPHASTSLGQRARAEPAVGTQVNWPWGSEGRRADTAPTLMSALAGA